MKYILIILIPVLIVGAAYCWRNELDEAFPWLKGWRTVVINAIPAFGILVTEIIGFAAGFGWDAIMAAETAAYMTLSTNVANIVLRFTTNTPVGAKESA